jgi:hypothetical protein
MAVARANPLLPGVYWLNIFRPFGAPRANLPDQDPPFLEWVAANQPNVHVLRRELDDTVTADNRVGVFYVFEVGPGAAEAKFPFVKLGFPQIQKLASAPGGITDTDRAVEAKDTFQAPEPAGLGDFLTDVFSSSMSSGSGALLLLALGLYLYSSNSRKG